MSESRQPARIRVLVADDDERVLDCYRDAFRDGDPTDRSRTLNRLAAELFVADDEAEPAPRFEIVACRQGEDAVAVASAAADDGRPFDVVILDVRMPPGIDGVETGSRIRELDPDVEIVFVSGYSDLPLDELQRRVPPPMKLHYFNKPLSFVELANDVANLVRTL